MAEEAAIGEYRKLIGHLGFVAEHTLDYTLNNPDTLTKYKTAAQISHKVLEVVTGECALSKVLSLC